MSNPIFVRLKRSMEITSLSSACEALHRMGQELEDILANPNLSKDFAKLIAGSPFKSIGKRSVSSAIQETKYDATKKPEGFLNFLNKKRGLPGYAELSWNELQKKLGTEWRKLSQRQKQRFYS